MQYSTSRGHGFVYVQNGQTKVRGVYEILLNPYTPGSGPTDFTPGETIQRSAVNLGIVVAFDNVADKLWMYRDQEGQAEPALADVLTGVTSGASGTIDSFTVKPLFSTWFAGGTFPKMFSALSSGIPYFLSSTIDTDFFVLTAAYQELTEDELEWSVSQDYEPERGYPLLNPGDVDAVTIISRAIAKIGGDMTLLGIGGAAPAWTAFTAIYEGDFQDPTSGTDVEIQPARYWKDPHGLVHLDGGCESSGGAGTLIATLPSGYRPALKHVWIQSEVVAPGAEYVRVDTNGEIESDGVVAQGVSLTGIVFDSNGGS